MNFKVDFDFFNRCVSILKESNEKYVAIAELTGFDVFSGFCPWGSLHRFLVDMLNNIFSEEEKRSIFTYYLANCRDNKNFEQESTLCYEICNMGPKIGKLVSCSVSKFDPEYCINVCQLEKPENMDWVYLLWTILTRDYNGNN